ncbi:LysR family transcriptional regulator [Methylobacterium oryzae]|uniref:LysR family transcriptional regulator n=1 Tax=Methylobacterium oryzae TaxID=334852 RepID=A0ABU7TVJ0_9HYPH
MYAFSRFMRYFVEVAEQGSIRRASETLNVSASAINRQILLVEEELGVPLFERLPGGLRMTAAGELMLGSGRRWAKDFDRLNGQISDLVGLRAGHVRIATIDALSRGFLPDVVRDIKADHPDLLVEVSILENDNVQTCIEDARADFGLMINPRPTRDTGIRAQRPIDLGFVTPPRHPLSRRAGARFSSCIEYPIVAPTPPLALSKEVDFLQVSTGVRFAATAASDNIQMLKSLIASGVGVGILTYLDVMAEVRTGELAFTPIVDRPMREMHLALWVLPSRQLSRAATIALRRVEQALNERAFGHPPD